MFDYSLREYDIFVFQLYMAFQTKFSQTLNGNFHFKQKNEKKTPNVCLLQYKFTISLGKFTFIIMVEGFKSEDSKRFPYVMQKRFPYGLDCQSLHFSLFKVLVLITLSHGLRFKGRV